MKTANRTIPFSKIPKEYSRLVAMYPPRPIHDATDASNLGEVIGSMTGYKLNQDQQDYLTLLVSILRTWQSSLSKRPRIPTHEMVEFLMEQNDMTQTDLAKLLGVRQSLVSMMLSGKRAFSKASIKILCDRFHVDARMFL